MDLNEVSALRGVRVMLLGAFAQFEVFDKQVEKFENLRVENETLRMKNMKLSLSNQRLQDIVSENIRLKKLLKYKEDSNNELISAKVIASGLEGTIRSLILDAGSIDGVKEGYAVVTDAGLVGRIISVTEDQSVVQILMDRNARISGRLQNSREIGIVAWSGNLWLDLNFISKDIDVAPGEAVVTSGLSDYIPKGIKIGVVGEVEQDDYGLFKKIKIKNSVNYSRLEEVFILLPGDSLKTEQQVVK